MHAYRAPIAILLAILLIAPGLVSGQTQKLTILVLEGRNAFNDITAHTCIPPVVEVRDSNDRPVEGAEVTFTFPTSGPSLTFENNIRTKTFRTGVQGQAGALNAVPNNQAGEFEVKVRATFGSASGEITIPQSNVVSAEIAMRPHKSWYKSWKWIAIIAAGAVVGGVLLARRGGGTSSQPTVTVTPGPVIIGSPN